MKTLICMPTYNEAENIDRIVPAVLAAVDGIEVLIIDDASPDGTGAMANALAEADARVHVLHREGKAGLGPAYVAGFRWGLDHGYDAMIEMDADFSHQPEHLPELVAQLGRYDVVVGSRYVAGGGTTDWGLARRLISRGGGFYARAILGVDVRDLTAGFVGWRASSLERLNLDAVEAAGYVFQIEMKYRAHQLGLSILEVPITFPDRVAGESKMTPSIALEALWRVWKIRYK